MLVALGVDFVGESRPVGGEGLGYGCSLVVRVVEVLDHCLAGFEDVVVGDVVEP